MVVVGYGIKELAWSEGLNHNRMPYAGIYPLLGILILVSNAVLYSFSLNLYIHLALEPSPFLLELPNFLCHLKHFCMKLKAEVFQVEDSIWELQQEINSANLSATR